MAPSNLTVIFKNHQIKNEAKSKKAGRPIFEDMEVCEIRTPGDRQKISVFPAHSFSHWQTDDDGGQEPVTYAMRFPEQYRRFKSNQAQVQEGTPLEELPFLTQGKRLELKALSIYTAEQLASLDGANLKTLGIGGRELKNQAQAYLDLAAGSADTTKMAAEIEALKQTIADLQAGNRAADPFDHDGDGKPGGSKPKAPDGSEDSDGVPSSQFDALDDDEIKEWIASETGSKPRGNPNRDTLIRMAEEIEASKGDDGRTTAA